MSALANLANPVAIPFFDRIPRRLMPAVRRACDRVETSRDAITEQHKALLLDIAGEGVPAPTLDEFRAWFDEVKLGRFSRADYDVVKPYEPVAKGVIERMLVGQFGTVAHAEVQAEDYLRRAHAIILAAVRLQQAKTDAGYSSESSETEDQIVADALAEWLTAEAVGWGQAMHLSYTPADVAMAMLNSDDGDQNTKLLDVFATHMQRELCLAIAGRANGGAE